MARVEITTSELIDALRAATGNGEEGPADAFTRNEIKAMTHWGFPRITDHLTALKQQGLLDVVWVNRERLDGRVVKVPGYRFLRPAKKARN